MSVSLNLWMCITPLNISTRIFVHYLDLLGVQVPYFYLVKKVSINNFAAKVGSKEAALLEKQSSALACVSQRIRKLLGPENGPVKPRKKTFWCFSKHTGPRKYVVFFLAVNFAGNDDIEKA